MAAVCDHVCSAKSSGRLVRSSSAWDSSAWMLKARRCGESVHDAFCSTKHVISTPPVLWRTRTPRCGNGVSTEPARAHAVHPAVQVARALPDPGPKEASPLLRPRPPRPSRAVPAPLRSCTAEALGSGVFDTVAPSAVLDH